MTLVRSAVALSIFVLSLPNIFTNDINQLERRRRAAVFPSGTVLQFSLGLQTPVTVPNRTFSISIALQSQYFLPTDWMTLRTKPEVATKRDVSHKNLLELYLPVESILEDYGFNGRECLLRVICESAETPFQHDKMGLFEEIAHAFLTPSDELYPAEEWCNSNTSVWMLHASHDKNYLAAECLGRSDGDCSLAYPNCPQSPLEFFSQKQNFELTSEENYLK